MLIEPPELQRHWFRTTGLLLMVGSILSWPMLTAAIQDEDDASQKGAEEQEVIIKREALSLTDPRTYRASLHLVAVRSLDLTAPTDGYVRTVSARSGQKAKQQSEAVRLDDARATLVLKKSKAVVQGAQLEKKLAQARSDADNLALAEARLEAAQADLELAQWDADQLVIRAPFNGEYLRVHVAEGQFVRAGERLATLIDPSRLVVEVPVERSAAALGGMLDIRVEEVAVKARIETVQALSPQFDSLRELTVSPATALVSIDNASGKFSAGQTVYSELIPLAPVAMVPAIAISNVSDGNRKVQVLRENVIRNLTVKILSKVGTDNVFVAGRFSEGDEVVVSTNRELADGTPLRALVAAAANNSANPQAGVKRTGADKPAGGGKKAPTTGF